ncbi:Hypothetical predicted protein [Podarcis lilfordi]|uniref:Uncharacterized protein n=1 Tax=Podarcis lilfordi TaxID=74358 RepID=A0AA35PSX0_9SAUR|nr:Hypothetical predicted protein [Podarcis lilfordi]
MGQLPDLLLSSQIHCHVYARVDRESNTESHFPDGLCSQSVSLQLKKGSLFLLETVLSSGSCAHVTSQVQQVGDKHLTQQIQQSEGVSFCLSLSLSLLSYWSLSA